MDREKISGVYFKTVSWFIRDKIRADLRKGFKRHKAEAKKKKTKRNSSRRTL
jgi:5-methylcytosine-specific restriction endonuclease McrBC GTP-binding regulatory subunit McrB